MAATGKIWLGWNPVDWAKFNRWSIPFHVRTYLQIGPVVWYWR